MAPNGTGTDQDYVSLYNNGSIGVRRNSGDDSAYLWSGISGATQTSRINKDGSASFAGDVTSGARDTDSSSARGIDLNATGSIYWQVPGTQSNSSTIFKFTKGKSSGGGAEEGDKITFKADGSATFASTITAAGYSMASLAQL